MSMVNVGKYTIYLSVLCMFSACQKKTLTDSLPLSGSAWLGFSGATKRVLQVADGRDRPRHPEFQTVKKRLKHTEGGPWG